MTGADAGRDELGAELARRHATACERLALLEAQHAGIVGASRGSNADDEHDPEGATIAFERAQIEALARQARAEVAELDAALARMSEGTFGVCERCGQPIPAGRLLARPSARWCVACAGQSLTPPGHGS